MYKLFYDKNNYNYYVMKYTGSFWQQVGNYTPYKGVAMRWLEQLELKINK